MCGGVVFGLVPSIYAATQAYEGHTKFTPNWSLNVTSNNATVVTADWSASAALIANPAALCSNFHITAKPYWLLMVMSVLQLAMTGYFFGDGTLKGRVAYLKLAYLLYCVIACMVEMYEIATLVVDFDGNGSMEKLYPGKSQPWTGWDAYQMVFYLWTQSSIGSTVAGFLYSFAMLNAFRAEVNDDGTHFSDLEADRAVTVMTQESRAGMRFGLFFSCLCPLIPTMITHILPMMIIYCYLIVGQATLATIFVGVVWGITNCCAKLGGSLEFLSIFAKASTEFDSYIPIFWFIMS